MEHNVTRERLFQVENVGVSYGKREVLRQVSFSVESGTLACLLGPNGCGKSTLMKSIAGQLGHQGYCRLNGNCLENLTLRQLAQKVSYIPQRSGITISLPVLDVVMMGFNPKLKLLERPNREMVDLAKAALQEVGLAGCTKQDYLTLSEGQKQLTILARLLIEDADLLLLDEPDSALDVQNRHIMMKKIGDIIKGRDKAGLLSLHDPMLALTYCDQLILIKDGTCIGELYPQVDNLADMEVALRHLYENIRVVELCQRAGKRHFALIWEDTI